MGKQWKQRQILFLGAPKLLQMVTAVMKLKDACSLEKSYDQPRQHIIKQRNYFANKDMSGQGYGFSNSPVWMWALDYKESWVPNYWCFWTVVLEKTLESPLDWKKIQPVNPNGDQSWVFIGRTDTEAETPILWQPHMKSWLIWKDSDAGRDWGQKEKGTTGWDGWIASPTRWTWVWVNSGSWWWTGRPVCCSSWGHKESDRTEWLNWTEPNVASILITFIKEVKSI